MGNKITRRRPAIDDRHTRLQGLYPSRDIDQRKLRRLILDSKLAPCYPGGEEPAVELEECPICFLHYPSLNRSKCCTKGICTECFLQMQSPNVTRPTQCPYCKMANYSVEYRGPKSMEEKGVEQAEEQKVIEAKIRMRQKELEEDEKREQWHDDDQDGDPPSPPAPSLPAIFPPPDLEQDSWQVVWESISHPSEDLVSVGLSQRPVGRPVPIVEPADSLWVQGSQQSDVEEDEGRAAQQQARPAFVSNVLPSALRHNAIVEFPTPQSPPVAQLTSGEPTSEYSQQNRDDEFDLDLEDIMVMEAIWLSIQEEGAQHRYTDNERCIAAAGAAMAGSLSTGRTNSGVDSEGSTDVRAIMPSRPPPLLPALPPPSPALSVLETQVQAPRRCSSVTGGLAGAIAALAERQVAGGDTTSVAQQSTVSILPPDPAAVVILRKEVAGTNQACEVLLHGEEELEIASPSEPLQRRQHTGSSAVRKLGLQKVKDERERMLRMSTEIEILKSQREGESASPIRDSENANTSDRLANWVGLRQWEYRAAPSMSRWSGDQSLEQVEIGTSFSHSIPSASDLAWEAPDIQPDRQRRDGESSTSMDAGAKGAVVVPESFDEQMMLAMALSLAEQARVHRDGGSLIQQSSNMQW
ncbi:hypothetical protein BDL97_07G098500 [Sphagnum fallax]|nr:hypothetical protein BDL97_07G098500 [Sphagnum fallax]